MSNPSFIEKYKEDHQHPINKLTHSIGIPLIVVSLPLFFWRWKLALALFIVGWILQFIGHLFEGKKPSFLKHPVYLLVGPVWYVRNILTGKAFKKEKIEKPHL
ncbi:DUF962 domain-containing protein [Fictibacillus enclensis]|uniref:DUF962 domain-containing protein n=1 Tax=Fictibacillus enclensis TaxID=1017270 RepID=UPI0024BFE2A5|nr:DUF962 domain-containing protein [Fictibacillus enclensis]MDM5336681.1 DUF962 domain-containing protein [Fictibacillus enclensis]WHY73114.1 DUF962 domain-containing protein [Fictibacillus enclensis]